MENNENMSSESEEQTVTTHEEGDQFYSKADKYWKGISPTVDGMLGGYAHISSTDIAGSTQFINYFIKPPHGKTKRTRALDCGAGIGRITKRLILPLFEKVDMVELNGDFLQQAKTYLGGNANRVERYICCGLQDFTPDDHHYDVIWCQWVLGHLTDSDFISFFQRCQKGLTENGVIIVKENVVSTQSADFDERDSSYTRPRSLLLELFEKGGLKILKEEKQKKFPKEIYDVIMFALQ